MERMIFCKYVFRIIEQFVYFKRMSTQTYFEFPKGFSDLELNTVFTVQFIKQNHLRFLQKLYSKRRLDINVKILQKKETPAGAPGQCQEDCLSNISQIPQSCLGANKFKMLVAKHLECTSNSSRLSTIEEWPTKRSFKLSKR